MSGPPPLVARPRVAKARTPPETMSKVPPPRSAGRSGWATIPEANVSRNGGRSAWSHARRPGAMDPWKGLPRYCTG
eukprot:9472410-Pyramimonas_sp.AAC.1